MGMRRRALGMDRCLEGLRMFVHSRSILYRTAGPRLDFFWVWVGRTRCPARLACIMDDLMKGIEWTGLHDTRAFFLMGFIDTS